MLRWSLAYDRFALGAALVPNQLSLQAAMAHKSNCLEKAFQEARQGRSPLFAAFYDDAARRSWSERKNSGEVNFDPCRAALHPDVNVLSQVGT